MFETLKRIYQPLGKRFERSSKGMLLPVGLDIGSRSIKMVQLNQLDSNEWCLVDFRVHEIESGIPDHEESARERALMTALTRLVEEANLEGSNVAVSISGPSVTLKSIEMPWMSEEELQSHLTLEVERYLPYERDDIYWDYHISPRSRMNDVSSMFVNLVAAKKPLVDQRVALLKHCGLRPVVVDVDCLALANMFEVNYPVFDREPALLVNIGASGLNMITVGSHGYMLMRDVDLLGEWSHEVLHESFQVRYDSRKLPSQDTVDGKSLSVLVEEVFREIAHEIRRVIDDYHGHEQHQRIRQIWVCGGYAKVQGLADALSEHLSFPVEIADPVHRLKRSSNVEMRDDVDSLSPLLGVGVGLVFRGGQDHD